MKVRGKTYEVPDKGAHIARVVGLIDLGLQPPYEEGETPKYQIEITYELVSSEMKDGRPFHVSERITNSDSDKGTLYARMNTFGVTSSNLESILDKPCTVNVDYTAGGRAKVSGKAGVAALPTSLQGQVPPLRNGTFSFDPYSKDCDLAVFDSFPEWKQEMYTSALDFNEMALSDKLKGRF